MKWKSDICYMWWKFEYNFSSIAPYITRTITRVKWPLNSNSSDLCFTSTQNFQTTKQKCHTNTFREHIKYIWKAFIASPTTLVILSLKDNEQIHCSSSCITYSLSCNVFLMRTWDHFFFIGTHSIQGWTATTRHGVKEKDTQ